MQTAQLRLERVSLSGSVGSHYLLKDISFEVFTSDRIAIVGPSGAGKTSLLRLINRLSEPTAGSIYLENQDYKQIRMKQKIKILLNQEMK